MELHSQYLHIFLVKQKENFDEKHESHRRAAKVPAKTVGGYKGGHRRIRGEPLAWATAIEGGREPGEKTAREAEARGRAAGVS